MDKTAITVSLLCFIEIACLPLFMFRRDGELNLRWWLTASPFFMVMGLLIAALAGGIRPQTPASWSAGLGMAAAATAAASIALLSGTWGTHRVKISLWHQDNDAPRSIVTLGPYRLVRHPFYASFFLALISAVLALPHWATLAALAYSTVTLNLTAAREERRLSASEFGREYQEYARRTGRFLPRLVIRRVVAEPVTPPTRV
jgi:protein-S-isoprenylcysteine O-methyltransferase Ste14